MISANRDLSGRVVLHRSWHVRLHICTYRSKFVLAQLYSTSSNTVDIKLLLSQCVHLFVNLSQLKVGNFVPILPKQHSALILDRGRL